MSKTDLSIPTGFPVLLNEIKKRIQQAQTRAMLSVNVELIQLYWDIGQIIAGRQQQEGWALPSFPGSPANWRTNCPKRRDFPNETLAG